jgi:hypothetical protein
MPTSHSCCNGSLPENRPAERILGSCARAQGNPALYCRLVVETDNYDQWQQLIPLAEMHGMGPLLYFHFKEINALIPTETRRALMGLYLRYRHANAVRGRVLGEILHACQSAGIEMLVLKGAALAFLVYPQPALRPMRDIDLLVREVDGVRAQAILGELGFDTRRDAFGQLPADHHHLPIASREVGGLNISVEIHTNLFPPTRYYRPMRYEDLAGQAVAFQIDGCPAYTLGYEDMLWHIYRHALGPPLLLSPLRFIHLADLASLVDKFAEQIDWEQLQQRFPSLFNALTNLHFTSPWPDAVLERLHPNTRRPPADPGLDYPGWPRRPLLRPGRGVQWQVLADTLNPPEWWLRIFYGAGDNASRIWQRWVRHPFHILEWTGHYARERVQKRFA